MESFDDLNIKESYDSEEDDVLNDFYIPVLKNSTKYYRMAGFFTSASLAVAARGMAPFIRNGGRMKLVTSAKLNQSDVEAIVQGKDDIENLIGQKFVSDLENLEDNLVKDSVGALAWMISTGKLDIRIALVTGKDGMPLKYEEIVDDSLFHSKAGICIDDYGNGLSFSGSINETMRAWERNIENFKVFKGWKDEEKKYVDDDWEMFNKFWLGNTQSAKVIGLPNQAYQEWIKHSPESIDKIKTFNSVKQIKKSKEIDKKPEFGLKNLRDYQKEGVDNFFKENGRGFLEMATGTGKTFTALGIVKKLMMKEKHLCVVITCPLTHLMDDPWISSLMKFGMKCSKISGSVSKWRQKISNHVSKLNLGHIENLIIITTHDTASSPDFIKAIESIKGNVMLVADEVHGMGSSGRLEGLTKEYNYRLGLSATPKRWMDEEGTNQLEEFFGNTIYDFPLKRAIREGFLCEYDYIPHFVDLNAHELAKYRELSQKAAAALSMMKTNPKFEVVFQQLLNKRGEIIRGAEAKLETLSKILSGMEQISHCLIYTTYSQRKDVLMVSRKHLDLYHQFTFREKPDERKQILKSFDSGEYQALIAENCLDEGVDVPSTRTAIIMASTGNPRQYIQRRGRVLRLHPSKKNATIHDILVIPEVHPNDSSFEMERKLVKKEIKRYTEFAEASLNPTETLNLLHDIRSRFHL